MSQQKKSEQFSPRQIQETLKQADIILDEIQIEQLWKFHKHLRKRNEELNMTRIHSFTGMVRKHYIDCLLIPLILEKNGLALKGRVLDIGTGPGFPGVPLAIFLPQTHFILAEGRHKRVEFLQEVVDLLGLDNASVFGNRVHGGQDHEADVVITRAVETMENTMRHSQNNTQPDALFVFMKGPNCDDEITQLQKTNLYKLLLDEHYTLPDSTDNRRLVVWEKHKNTMQEVISSKENKRFKSLKQLQQTKYMKRQQECLVSGKKIIHELMNKNPDGCLALLHEPQMSIPKTTITAWSIEHSLFKELDTIGTRSPLLLYSLKQVQENDIEGTGLYLALPLQNPENLGAAIRSARAFGVHNIILFPESAHFAHPKTIRASAGLSLTTNYIYVSSIEELKEKSPLPIFGLDTSGEKLSTFTPQAGMILLVGEEGQGLPENSNIQKISIEVEKDVESLNASVALSIVLHKIYTHS